MVTAKQSWASSLSVACCRTLIVATRRSSTLRSRRCSIGLRRRPTGTPVIGFYATPEIKLTALMYLYLSDLEVDVALGQMPPHPCNAERSMPDALGRSTGALKGNRNNFQHGRYGAEAIAGRRKIRELVRAMRALARQERPSSCF
jgi:hypothetical protein